LRDQFLDQDLTQSLIRGDADYGKLSLEPKNWDVAARSIVKEDSRSFGSYIEGAILPTSPMTSPDVTPVLGISSAIPG
jgi:hypothetical protein